MEGVFSDDLGDLLRGLSRFSVRWQNLLDVDDKQMLAQVPPMLLDIASKYASKVKPIAETQAENNKIETADSFVPIAFTKPAPMLENWYEETSTAVAPGNVSAKVAPEDDTTLRDTTGHGWDGIKDELALTTLVPEDKTAPAFFIDPFCMEKMVWDIIGMLFLFYNIVVIPIRLAWDIDIGLENPVFIWESFVDWFFVVDICLNFRTGVLVEGKVIYNPKIVALKYAKTWLPIDLISSVPLDFFMTMSGGGSLKSMKMVRMIRLVKIFKLLRLLKMTSFLASFLDAFPVSKYPINMLGMLFSVAYLAHILACVNYWVARAADKDMNGGEWTGYGDDANSWVAGYQGGYMVKEKDDFNAQYLASMYWALTTITTVGYGDIIPRNDDERIWAMIAMSVGAATFGLIIGNISDFVMHKNAADQLSDEKLTAINEYMGKHNVPKVLTVQIRKFLRHMWQEKTVFDENVILEDLSTKLRTQLLVHVYEATLSSLSLFKQTFSQGSTNRDGGWGMAQELISQMKPVMYNRGDVILREGDLGSEMYFIMKGQVRLLASKVGVLKRKASVSGLRSVLKEWKGSMRIPNGRISNGKTTSALGRRAGSMKAKKNYAEGVLPDVKETGEAILLNTREYISITTLGRGSHFGEVALLTKEDLGGVPQYYSSHRRAATCVALAECSLHTLDAEPLREALRRHRHLRINLVSEAKSRINKIEESRQTKNDSKIDASLDPIGGRQSPQLAALHAHADSVPGT